MNLGIGLRSKGLELGMKIRVLDLGCPRSGQSETRKTDNPLEKHSFYQEKSDLKHFPNFEKSNFDQK